MAKKTDENAIRQLWAEFLLGRFQNGFISEAACDKVVEFDPPASFTFLYTKIKPKRIDTKSVLANLEARIHIVETQY